MSSPPIKRFVPSHCRKLSAGRTATRPCRTKSRAKGTRIRSFAVPKGSLSPRAVAALERLQAIARGRASRRRTSKKTSRKRKSMTSSTSPRKKQRRAGASPRKRKASSPTRKSTRDSKKRARLIEEI